MPRLHLPIQDPCHEDWDAMNSADGGRRFCDVCTKHVHDISSMTERMARAVLAEESQKGRVCVRYNVDDRGDIRFRPETVEAPNRWRMTLAAAGLAMMALTGCTDAPPDQILEDKCVYEVGPWTFDAPRGQGTCPAVDAVLPNYDPDDVVMGEAPAVIEWAPPEPQEPVMGKIAIDPEPDPEPKALMGDVAVAPDPEPKPDRTLMGAMKGPKDPEPEPERAVMGELAAEPCDGEPKQDPPDSRDGPRRL